VSWLGPAPAFAAEDDASELRGKLDRWVPTREELGDYLATVGELLRRTGAAALTDGALPPEYRDLYHRLILATAWQESCWRQYLKRGGAITYLTSAAGAVGLMQVNTRVWRGFYDVDGLRWDVVYNARAGEEILRHYLVRYGIATNEHRQPGGADNLARAAYAAYNGGPGHYRRYRLAKTARSLKRIDAAFYAKFQALAAGPAEPLVAECYGQ
jgi:soluble lytic murein transglycosylase-like protein